MFKKLLKHIAVLSLLNLLLTSAVSWWIFATPQGTKWILKTAQKLESRLQLKYNQGTLSEQLSLSNIRWQDGETQLDIADIRFDWRPSCLLQATLCLDYLNLEKINIKLPPSDDTTPTTKPESIELPTISLPLKIEIADLSLRDIQLETGDQPIKINEVSLRASAKKNQVTVHKFYIDHPQANGNLSGGIQLSQHYPIDMQLLVTLPKVIDGKDIVNQTNFTQSLKNVAIDGNISGLHNLTYNGQLKPLDSELPYQINIDWDSIKPIVEQAITIQQGKIRLNGDLAAYTLNVDFDVSGEPSPPAHISLKGNGDFGQLHIKPLQVTVLDGKVVTEGTVSWADKIHWDLQTKITDINPKFYLAEMPGALNAQLDFTGQPSAYQLKLAADIALKGIPKTSLATQANGDLKGIEIKHLNIETLGGTIKTQASVDWADSVSWQSQTNLSAINPGEQWPDMSGKLDGEIITSGRSAEQLSFDISKLEIAGHLAGYPTQLRGSINKTEQDQWRIKKLTLDSGKNHFTVNGTIDQQWALSGDIDFPAIDELFPSAKGRISGQLALNGPLKAPDINGDIEAEKLSFQDYQIDHLTLEADIKTLGKETSNVQLIASQLILANEKVSDLAVKLNGSQSDHRATLELDGENLSTKTVLTGSLDESTNWLGTLQNGFIDIPGHHWVLQTPTNIDWQAEQQQVNVAAHCWLNQSASFCLKEDIHAGTSGNAHIVLDGYQLAWLQQWLPSEAMLTGDFGAKLIAQWHPSTPPQIDLDARLTQPTITLSAESAEASQPVEFKYKTIVITAKTQDDKILSSILLDSKSIGKGDIQLSLQPDLADKPITGLVNIQSIKLDVLKPFVPIAQKLNGTLNAKGSLAGNLSAPLFNGNITLDDANFFSDRSPLQIENAKLDAAIQGTHLLLNGTWQSGQQPIILKGEADWATENWFADISLDSEQVILELKPELKAEISPHITAHIQPKKIDLKGNIQIPYARIVIEELPEGATQLSSDIVIIEPEKIKSEKHETWAVNTSTQVLLGNDVRLQGLGMKAQLSGDLLLETSQGKPPEASGNIIIKNGRYKAYGQDLTIEDGHIFFTGPIEQATLQMDAVRIVETVTAGLRINGNIMSPDITLFSDPAMSEENVVSYLVLGKPLDAESDSDENKMLAQAAVALGILGGQGIAKNIAEQLGVEDFQIEAESDDNDSYVVLSGRLAPNLFVSYGVGVFSQVNTLSFHYDINDKFYVETAQSLENAIDFFYKFEFD